MEPFSDILRSMMKAAFAFLSLLLTLTALAYGLGLSTRQDPLAHHAPQKKAAGRSSSTTLVNRI